MNTIRRCVSLLVFALCCGCGTQKTKPQPSPVVTAEPPEYPLPESTLLALRDRQDTHGIRKHAWAVFAEVTKNASATNSTPLWDTWIDEDDLFSGGAPPAAPHRKIQLPLEMVTKIRTSAKNDALALKLATELVQRGVGFETKYNDSAANHIRQQGLTDPASFQTRAATFVNLRAPVNERNIAPFPSFSIIVKASWRTVGPGVLQTFTMWDPPDPSRPDCLNGCASKTQIKVKLAEPGQPCNRPSSPDEPYLSSCFYSVPASNVPGYVLILFGLHVITKETRDWTWSTFWWQADPDKGKFADDRPGPNLIPGFWRNYVMDSTLSMQTPQEPQATAPAAAPSQRCRPQPSTTAKICFNPFIEGTDPTSTVSNCITCHLLSTYPAMSPDPRGVIQRGYLSFDDACFGGSAPVMKVDYVWKLSPVTTGGQLDRFLSTLESQIQIK